MKTRSIVASPGHGLSTTTDTAPQVVPHLLVVPKAVGEQACIITLAHPRRLCPTRYYFCPDSGIYEFTKTRSAPSAYRSLLLAPSPEADIHDISLNGETKGRTSQSEEANIYNSELAGSIGRGYVTKTAEIFTATPIDPLFLLLPVLAPESTSTRPDETKTLFLSSDDLFEKLINVSKSFDLLVEHEATRHLLESRMEAVCEMVEAGDEKMYRLSVEKLLEELVRKSRRMVAGGLPASMEERFIKRALDVPLLGIKRHSSIAEDNVDREIEGDSPDTNVMLETSDSQSSTATAMTADSQVSTSTSLTSPDQASEESAQPVLFDLLRLRTALSFLISSYVAPHLAKKLTDIMASPASPTDFKPLDIHLAHTANIRAEAQANRSLSDFSRKRGTDDDAEARTEKRRKKEEEEKRKKAGESRGVRDLKKVDTKGMKKMSDFFGKKVGTKT